MIAETMAPAPEFSPNSWKLLELLVCHDFFEVSTTSWNLLAMLGKPTFFMIPPRKMLV